MILMHIHPAIPRRHLFLATIALVLGFAFIANYSGVSSTLALAIASSGHFFPFFSPVLGWLGVFLTGSDTASNALFGSLQRITANQLHLNEILIVATNSTGGVMGKMIDAQSIMVAGAACYDIPQERAHAVGPIFRKVWWHSVAGAAFIGVIALIQSQMTGCVPEEPPPPPPKSSSAAPAEHRPAQDRPDQRGVAKRTDANANPWSMPVPSYAAGSLIATILE